MKNLIFGDFEGIVVDMQRRQLVKVLIGIRNA